MAFDQGGSLQPGTVDTFKFTLSPDYAFPPNRSLTRSFATDSPRTSSSASLTPSDEIEFQEYCRAYSIGFYFPPADSEASSVSASSSPAVWDESQELDSIDKDSAVVGEDNRMPFFRFRRMRKGRKQGVQVMIDFQAAEKKRLEEPASDIGLEPLCAMINNLRCYDLAMELSNSTIEAPPQNYAEQVNFEDTCKGFLEVAKEAVHLTVRVIFEDPGVQELLVKLYHKDRNSTKNWKFLSRRNGRISEWCEGHVTEYLVATFADYFSDVKMYVEERSFRKFVEACLEETVVIYVDHLLTQKNYIKEEMIERMRLDEEVLVDFFTEYISVSKLESRIRILSDLRELASAESLDTFTLVYSNILEHQPDCPAEVVEKLVGLREGIPRKDAKEVVQECKEIYENSLDDGNPPKSGFVFSRVKCLSASKGSLWRKLT